MRSVGTVSAVHDAFERARDALQNSHVFSIRKVQVEEYQDRIQISGQVASFYQKQQAQEIVRAVTRGVRLVNRILVR